MDLKGRLPLLIIVFAGLFYGFMDWEVASQFKQLPSPLYGGDYYYQLGQITRMYETGPMEWLGSNNGIGERPGYLPVYGALVAVFGKALSLGPMQAMLCFSALVPLLSLLAFFFLGKEVFGDGKVAALLALVLFPGAMVLKYTEFVIFVIAPLFLGMLFRFSKKPDLQNGALLGLMYGIISFSHGSGFPTATVLMGAVFAYMGWKAGWKLKGEEALPYGVAVVIGVAIAMLYWLEPIFVYHGSTVLKSETWSFPYDLHDFGQGIGLAVELLSSMLFNFSGINAAARSALVLAGLYLAWKNRLWETYGVLAVVVTVALAVTFSFLITAPLLDIQFMPDYVASIFGRTAVVLVSGFALQEILKRWEISLYLIAALLLFSGVGTYQGMEGGPYYEGAISGLPPEIEGIYAGVKANTDVHDKILSTNEVSFAINAMTGRELLVSRRAQNDPFVDFDKNELAAAAILYGNNLDEKKRLVEEYGVDYLYADYNWVDSEFYFDEGGQMSGMFDPLLVMDIPENRAHLDANGVLYTPMTTWIDPAVKGPKVRLYDVLIIGPENYEMTGEGPWKNDLDPYLEEVFSQEAGGQKIAVLYKLNIR